MRIFLGVLSFAWLLAGLALTFWVIASDLRKRHRDAIAKHQRMEWLGRLAQDVGVRPDPRWSEGELRDHIRTRMLECTGRRGRPLGLDPAIQWSPRSDTDVLETLAAEAREIDQRSRP